MDDQIKQLQEKLSELSQVLHISDKRERLLELKKLSEDPNLWQDQKKAVQINSELADLNKEVEEYGIEAEERIIVEEVKSDAKKNTVRDIQQDSRVLQAIE